MLNLFYPPYSGGTEKHVFEVSRRLAKKHDVTVLTSRLPGTAREETIEGVRIIRTEGWVLKSLPYPLPPPVPVSPFLVRSIKEEAAKTDIIHLHNRFFYSFLDLKGLKRNFNVHTGLTIHNARVKGIDTVTNLLGQAYDDLIGYRIMRDCDRIAAVSRDALESTVPKNLWKNSRVIYNGVDLKFFNTKVKGDKMKRELNIKGKVVLSVARLVKQKGLNYLINAFEEINDGESNLVIFGHGPEEKSLKKMIEKKGLQKKARVIWSANIEKRMNELYAMSDVFVLPSLYEPFGMVLVEAMASGKPVIGSEIGGIPEVITEKNGLLFEPKNVNQLKDKVETLLSDEKKRRQLGLNGRHRAEKIFNWDNTAKGYESMYRGI
jgi:glycosyltransferase involved in cell wall biosynthesis